MSADFSTNGCAPFGSRLRDDFGVDILHDVVALLETELPRVQQAIRASFEASDFAALERHAHSLKGSLGFFDVDDLLACALKVERQARARQVEKAAVTELLDALANFAEGIPREPGAASAPEKG